MSTLEPIISVVPVNSSNSAVYERLIQFYECEFSAITEKRPLSDGRFELDTHLGDSYFGFLACQGDTPCGFNVVKQHAAAHYEVAEFFIVPVFRRQDLGFQLMASICDQHKGQWEIKQIAGADSATAFWRRAVSRYTNGDYTEDIYQDPYWGKVTRQVFNSRNNAP